MKKRNIFYFKFGKPCEGLILCKQETAMSTYVLMKILESAPLRYDTAINLLTFGTLNKAYKRLTANIRDGQRVLDVGCGTGSLSLQAAGRGASVKGIDINPGMLEVARTKAAQSGLSQSLQFTEIGVAELSGETDSSYDVVMSGLCFSELSEDEIMYTLRQIRRLLKDSGQFLLADEVKPDNPLQRLLLFLLRLPFVILTYLLTQTTTHSVRGIEKKIQQAGFEIISVHKNMLRNFIEITAKKI